MAIYSCNVSSIGRTTNAPGTAGAHLSYIAREQASPTILAEHMPTDPTMARTWMDREERASRANARLGTKIRLALPRELTADQRAELVTDFMGKLAGGRVPWYAGIHQTGEDEHNPHVHIFVRDKDVETGKRVLLLTDSPKDREKAGLVPNGVEWIRERWEVVCNDHLERRGIEARIDRRSLEAQGIDREPTIHIGPRAAHIEGQVRRPASTPKRDRRGRVIDYPSIDQGRTRKERCAEIVDLNLERAARSPDLETRERAKFEKAQRVLDRKLEAELIAENRRKTGERRAVRAHFKRKLDELRGQAESERQAALATVRNLSEPRVAQLRTVQASERAALKDRQSTVWQRVLAAIDITGTVRKKREAARKLLAAEHRHERGVLAKNIRNARAAAQKEIRVRYEPKRQGLIAERDAHLAVLRNRHREADRAADARRQGREAERERGRNLLDQALQVVKSQAGPARNRGGPSLGR